MLTAVCAAGFTACSSNTSSADSSVVSESSDNGGSASSDSAAAEMVKNAPATGGNIGDVTIQSGDIVAEFEIDGFGIIKAKLFPDIAPVGVQNFIQLAQDGYYTGKNIHRVISDFMLQGGSENGDGTGGSAAYSGEEAPLIPSALRLTRMHATSTARSATLTRSVRIPRSSTS